MTAKSAALRPIETTSLPERVTIELRRAILSGRLAPGETFSLREIAAELDVSFIPVREAMRNLEAEGLVITRPGKSARVAPLDLDDLHAIYRLRRTLEPEIARRACRLLHDAELDRLEQTAAGFGDEQRGMNVIYEDHHTFHAALLAPATTVWDQRILMTLWRASERYIRIGFGRLDMNPSEHHRREQAHEHLVAGFRTRDPEVAAGAIYAHLARNEKIAVQSLADTPSAASAPTSNRDGRPEAV
ncbi:MAG: GntR family transcriptional regulator [Acidimicrobiales bacterium]